LLLIAQNFADINMASEKPKLQHLTDCRFDSDVFLKYCNQVLGNQTSEDFFKPTFVVTQKQDFQVGLFGSVNNNPGGLGTPKTFASELIYASSAFPSLWKPIKLTTLKREGDRNIIDENEAKKSYSDGGLCSNNPALLGAQEVCKYYKIDRKKLNIISLGNGTPEKAKDLTTSGGAINWGDKIAQICISSNLSAGDFLAKMFYDNRYYRINPEIKKIDTGSFSKEYVNYLHSEASNYIKNNAKKLDEIAAVIKRCYSSRKILAPKPAGNYLQN